MKRVLERRPDNDVQLWFQDEAYAGSKGRNAHVCYAKGRRPTVRPTHGPSRPKSTASSALAAATPSRWRCPRADPAMRQIVLDAFSAARAPNAHAITVLDQADTMSPGG